MRIINKLPKTHVENKSCEEISNHLERNTDLTVLIRSWDNSGGKVPKIKEKYITIITSAEGHAYIPPEATDENCVGVFMHYPPKQAQYDPKTFIDIPKLYPLPLGSTDFYVEGEIKKLKDRKFDCCFIGQLDPYRRINFFDCMRDFSSIPGYNNNIKFYQGWNNGYSGEEYSDIMRNSKVAFVPWGSASLDTFRFYEAARSGCIIISSPQNNYDFMKKSPHIEMVWKPEVLLQTLKAVLNDQDLADKTYNFWKTNLSPKASSNYILSKVKI